MGVVVRRVEKKVHTRQALMLAALQLVEGGQHFSSLSIREITRQTGVVPTSFYRHFRDMDDLGLALVDELSMILRQLMREVRESQANAAKPEQLIRHSVDFFMQQVDANRGIFVFLTQELTGGSVAVRQAIRSELNFFTNELVLDINRYRILPDLSREMLEAAALLVIQIVSMAIVEWLDTAQTLASQRETIRQRIVRQTQLTFLGASHWKEKEKTV
ncbi:Transcriptional regulator [gamma proteobacterium HdN1]|nr:Transcriptional regulator [gamma proteobacterium HdN1]